MPTPKAGYFLKDGTKVPGTTGVIGRFKESGGLLQWAFKQGQSGKRHLYEEAEKAADIGTAAHAMVEVIINDPKADVEKIAADMLPDGDMRTKALSSFHAYQAWARNFKVKVVEQEIQLVSEKYKFGGTPDAIGLINNQLVLIDYKTSNSVYADYLFQLAAYAILWNENRPETPLTGGFHLCRFSKENGDFSHHYFPSLEDETRGFILMRDLYDICASAKKRAA